MIDTPTYRPRNYQKAYEDYIYSKMKMIGELYYKKHLENK